MATSQQPVDHRSHFLQEALLVFAKQKALGSRAMGQLDDDQLFARVDAESNSVAIIVKHMHGNMRSRWSDLLTSDGERPDRNRDDEFVSPIERSRTHVMEWWERGWQYVVDALEPLHIPDLDRLVTIRGESLSVTSAVLRQIDHYGQHVGQIVLLAKHLRGSEWKTLSIARGRSAAYLNERRA